MTPATVEMAPNARIYFERIAVTPWQIECWNLPGRPTKTTDSRSRDFGDTSVELDAIQPELLRGIVRMHIEKHLPKQQFEVLKQAEASEREMLRLFVRNGTTDLTAGAA
jgi:hypothetical protein